VSSRVEECDPKLTENLRSYQLVWLGGSQSVANECVDLCCWFTFITLAYFLTAPGAMPQDFTVEVLSDDSINLSWDPPPQDQQYGNITGYNVTYRAIEDNSIPTNTTTTNLSLTLTELNSNTTYAITVAAKNQYGLSNPAVQSKYLTT